MRQSAACTRLLAPRSFAELFALWHGRHPEDDEWPAPAKAGGRGSYEWQPPELALLATLVGQIAMPNIVEALSARLRERTGDPSAKRSRQAVQQRVNQIGLQSRDVVGGITVSEAGREVGSLAIVQHAIRKSDLRAGRVGHLLVIPHEAWSEWKTRRVGPPEGYVRLSTIKAPLSIASDKLSEWARLGYVPTAIRCSPCGTSGPSTQFGTWYIAEEAALQLIADRRSGKPMPWHGKPLLDNLRATFKLWQSRRHPRACRGP